jgi:hypothetical protein
VTALSGRFSEAVVQRSYVLVTKACVTIDPVRSGGMAFARLLQFSAKLLGSSGHCLRNTALPGRFPPVPIVGRNRLRVFAERRLPTAVRKKGVDFSRLLER